MGSGCLPPTLCACACPALPPPPLHSHVQSRAFFNAVTAAVCTDGTPRFRVLPSVTAGALALAVVRLLHRVAPPHDPGALPTVPWPLDNTPGAAAVVTKYAGTADVADPDLLRLLGAVIGTRPGAQHPVGGHHLPTADTPATWQPAVPTIHVDLLPVAPAAVGQWLQEPRLQRWTTVRDLGPLRGVVVA
jgi:hypothetical protein